MKENKKEKIKSITKHAVVILLLLGIIVILTIASQYVSNHVTELTQLSPQGKSQMMGYLIKTEEGKVIAIDGGTVEDTENWIKHVERLGGKVDTWFISHPHKDHASVFQEVVKNHPEIEIEHVYYTANSIEWYEQNDQERASEVENFYQALQTPSIQSITEEVQLNQKIDIDNIKFEILGVKNSEITINPINNSSMVLKMTVGDKSILFLGDTGTESGEKLLKNQKEKLKANIVQMAHHGQAGVTEEVYQAIKPNICLWPTPKWLWDNDVGEGFNTAPYKTVETRDWIEKMGIKQNLIAKDGDITIQI